MKKTASRIMQRFYWPTLFRDVADFCWSCSQCQKASHRRERRIPMVPLPVIGEPFERIAMDIIGPLPRSRGGHRYVLVVCDYATRYPEVIPMRTIDAEAVAEELMKMFSRTGIPKEILTGQGTNFSSQLLLELYQLLHVNLVEMPDRRKKKKVLHVNMLKKWNEPVSSGYFVSEAADGEDEM